MVDPDARDIGRDIAEAIRGFRFVYNGEAELQGAIAEALERNGFEVGREVRLVAFAAGGERRDAGRIDLLVGRVGVEVKVAGSALEVTRQVRRYLASDLLDCVVLVTRRVVHLNVPRILDDDRVVVVALPLSGGGL